MAHLPELVEDFDDVPPASDPVVRMPKAIVALPEPPAYAMRTVLGVALVGLLIGATLGLVGVGIVYATHHSPDARAAAAAAARRRARAARARARADAGAFALTAAARADAGEATGPGAGLRSSQQRLGRGRTLPVVLRALGLDNALAARVIRALRPLINMRALQPTDVVVAQRDPAAGDALRRVEYRRSPTQVWAVTVGADGACTGERIEVVRTTARLAAGFRVEDSLEAALAAARLHPDIVARLQEVFPLLDLGRELRRGDAVRLIVEEERLNGTFFRYGRVEAIEFRGARGHRRAFFQQLSPRGGGDFFDAEGRTYERGPLRAPLNVPRLTSPFNLRRMHPVLHRVMPHLGCDFGADSGEPVFAAADGTVLSVGDGGPAGNLVRLAHPALGIETGYAHLSRFAPGLRPGMRVRTHQLVGYVGSTGRSTGPHLHFSVKRGEQFVDPMQFYNARRSVPAAMRAEFDQSAARLGAELDAVAFAGTAPAPQAAEPAADEAAPEADPADGEAPAE